ncbi:MAG: hypothetical protein JSR98_14020 [Proteobacteria bacterium]|nr:hypothetical protein [Pseudomonadota bacterium]
MSDYQVTARRALLSRRSFNKVFGIGAHKTGTTSLATVFQLCGLAVGDQAEGELTGYSARRGKFQKLIEYVQRADAFQDSPFADGSVYAALDAIFPESKFILTVRPAEDWFRSLSRFTAKRYGLKEDGRITPGHMEVDDYLFPEYVLEMHASSYLTAPPDYTAGASGELVVDWEKLFDKDHYIACYERRNAAIREHFKHRPEQLLEIDLTNEIKIDKVAAFLGLPQIFREVPMPHENRT